MDYAQHNFVISYIARDQLYDDIKKHRSKIKNESIIIYCVDKILNSEDLIEITNKIFPLKIKKIISNIRENVVSALSLRIKAEFISDKNFSQSGDFEFSPHINQGNMNNLLKLEYKGDHVVLFANNEQLETISINPSFQISRAGLVVDTIIKSRTKNVFEVHFDNLRYFRPKN